MATPDCILGFENGITPSVNGGGVWDHLTGSPAVINSDAHTGSWALQLNTTAAIIRAGNNFASAQNVFIGRLYFKFKTSLPANDCDFYIINNTDGFVITLRFYQSDGNKIGWRNTANDTAKSSNGIIADTYYCVDFKYTANTDPRTIDWKLDHVDQTSYSRAGAGSTATNYRFGSNTADTFNVIFDDYVCGFVSGDYPFYGTDESGTEALVPTGDGTHNAGANVIEAQDGTDIGATTAYDKINSIPPSSTIYIRQAINGTGNYAEVTFGNISASHSSILGVMVTLAYTSASTTLNNGGCIVSKDDFSSYTEIWGNPTTPQDYSDGSLSNFYFKSAIIGGVIDDTTVNALKARLGYSGDANPDPYWIDIIAEVGYAISDPTTTPLDLVTYSITVNALTILENELIGLDLVSYSTVFNAITLLENELIILDLVSFSSLANDISILENDLTSLALASFSNNFNDINIIESELIILDLVSYSSTFNDINVLENELIGLDFVTFSNTFNDLVLIEGGITTLDLISYSSLINDITLLENEIIALDLVLYSSSFNDITLLESETITLDLVSYSSSIYDVDLLEADVTGLDFVSYSIIFNDISVIETEILGLDLVSFSNTFNDLNLIDGGITSLDLVSYSITFNDINLLESEIITLDLISYSSLFNDIDIQEGFDSILLDLVSYSSVINDVLIVSLIKIPIDRCYFILEEKRSNIIESENRTNKIEIEERQILIY